MSNDPYRPVVTINELPISPQTLSRLIGFAVLIFLAMILGSQATEVVQPGNRGVRVTLGKVAPNFAPQGLTLKTPFVTRIIPVMIRQRTEKLSAECYSSDLQQVNTGLQLLYRIPEDSVVKIFQQYAGDPFSSLIAPRVQEALKEVTALQTAEMIVTNRFEVKTQALALAREKIGSDFLDVVDLIITDISLSAELENAIEQKMIREQEAAKAQFAQRQAEIDAATEIIRAKGVAEAIRIRGEALSRNPAFIDFQIVEQWDGLAPLVIGGGNGGNSVLIPLDDLSRIRK